MLYTCINKREREGRKKLKTKKLLKWVHSMYKIFLLTPYNTIIEYR